MDLASLTGVLACQIEEVALVTDKGTLRRRGFVFITFVDEDAVDKCTDKTFHTLEGHQVELDLLLLLAVCSN